MNVLDNIQRVTSDGARCETRFELDGANVSMTVRSLLGRNLIVRDSNGRLLKSSEPQARRTAQLDQAVLAQIREALMG